VDSDEETEEDDWLRGGRWARHPEAASSMHQLKMVDGVEGRWTVTDADADREGKRMIYSSITPFVHMLRTDEHDSEHTTLDFRAGRGDHFGIWSIRFSADGSEIVAGATSGSIMVYDVNAGRRTLNVLAHHDDVNAVCFADESSTNILVSGSDDGYVKVWDRRSLSSNIPSGVLAGATEGITYASPKGDGRYVVANSKDQAARLYDLRKMRSWSEFEDEPDAVSVYGLDDYDCGCRSFSANSRPERALPQAEAAGAPARLLRHDVPRPQRPPHPDPVPLLPGRVHRPGVHLLWVGGRPDPHLEPGRARRAGPEPRRLGAPPQRAGRVQRPVRAGAAHGRPAALWAGVGRSRRCVARARAHAHVDVLGDGGAV
jgi:WD40 repeat protein